MLRFWTTKPTHSDFVARLHFECRGSQSTYLRRESFVLQREPERINVEGVLQGFFDSRKLLWVWLEGRYCSVWRQETYVMPSSHCGKYGLRSPPQAAMAILTSRYFIFLI